MSRQEVETGDRIIHSRFCLCIFSFITSYLNSPNKSTTPYSGKLSIMPRIVLNALAVSLDRNVCSSETGLFVCNFMFVSLGSQGDNINEFSVFLTLFIRWSNERCCFRPDKKDDPCESGGQNVSDNQPSSSYSPPPSTSFRC